MVAITGSNQHDMADPVCMTRDGWCIRPAVGLRMLSMRRVQRLGGAASLTTAPFCSLRTNRAKRSTKSSSLVLSEA
jgi:hypothetical protein